MRQADEAGEFQNNSKSGEGIPMQSGMFGCKPPLRLDFCCFERARWLIAWSKGFGPFALKGRKNQLNYFDFEKSSYEAVRWRV